MTLFVIDTFPINKSIFSIVIGCSNLEFLQFLRIYHYNLYLTNWRFEKDLYWAELLKTVQLKDCLFKENYQLQRKLDCLKKSLFVVAIRRKNRVRLKLHKRSYKMKTIPSDLSEKQAVFFMMHTAFKVMNTCLWYLDSGCSRHMTGDQSFFKTFEPRRGGNITFGDTSKSLMKGKWIFSVPSLLDIVNVLYVEGLRVNLLRISQICDQDFMVLFSKGKCLVLDGLGKQLIGGVRILDNCYGLVLDVVITCNNVSIPNEDLWHQRMGHASYKQLAIVLRTEAVLGLPKLTKVDNVVCGPCQL